MKILMFSGDYWPNEGGIAAYVHYLAAALDQAGHQVTVVGGHRRNPKAAVGFRREPSPDVNRILIRRRGPRIIRGVVFLLEAVAALARLAKVEWDVIHFHNFVPDGILLGVLKWPRARIRVMTNHSSQYLMALDSGRSTAGYQVLTRTLNGFVAPSSELRERTLPLLRSRQVVKYIESGVDEQLFSPGEPRETVFDLLQVRKGQAIVLAARRHTAKCGLEFLVRAIPAIVERHPDVVFCLAGSGEQTGLLRQLAADLGVTDYVRVPGNLGHDVLPDVYRAAYLSVLPSLYEAVSLAGLESLSSGTPVVGTMVGGIPAFVQEGITGMLVHPGRADELTTAICTLLDQPELRARMSLAGRALVLQSFTWKMVAKNHVDYYAALRNIERKASLASA